MKLNYKRTVFVGFAVFLICAFFSPLMYGKLGSTKNEEEFQ